MSLLRQLFGPSKKEIWHQLSEKINATFVDGGWFGKDKVEAKHRQWVITLDTEVKQYGKTTVTYTRICAPFINKDGFRFNIYRKGFFSDAGKYFGVEDVEVGFDDLDYDFIIQGNDHYKLWKMFAHDRIRSLIKNQPDINLKIIKAGTGWFSGTDFDDNVDMVEFRVRGVMKDITLLQELFNLFAEVLDHLCTIGSAYEDDPKLKNYYV